MKFRSTLVDQGSGVLGTLVVEKNGVMRTRNIPANPNSTGQRDARSALTAAAVNWRDLLTDPQRVAWNAYATTVSRKDALGKNIKLSGIGMYVASFCAMTAVGQPPPAEAPATIGALGVPDIDTIVFDASADTCVVTFADNVDGTVHAALYLGPSEVSPGRASYSGPYRFKQAQDGDGSAVITFTGLTINAAADKIGWKLTFVDDEGRVARPLSGLTAAVA